MSSCNYKTGSVLFTTGADFKRLSIPPGRCTASGARAQEQGGGLRKGEHAGGCDQAGAGGELPSINRALEPGFMLSTLHT